MYEDVLARVEFFSGLGKKELQTLAATCRERKYSPGSVLISQGETGTGLYILTKGTVRITRAKGSAGEQEVLGTAKAGDVLGEMALLDDLPRSASVTAEDEVTALLLPVWEFRTTLRGNPDIALHLLAVLSRRLRKAEQRAYE
jgi:CRP/FNR family transcriptional regulator, cyclic AMP receptor protein